MAPPGAIPPGQMDTRPQDAAPTPPPVYFRGMFKNPTVPWVEGLRLTDGLFQAEFQGLWSPTEIVVIRKGRPYRVNANRMLRGQENPLLEPADTVEIRR